MYRHLHKLPLFDECSFVGNAVLEFRRCTSMARNVGHVLQPESAFIDSKNFIWEADKGGPSNIRGPIILPISDV